MTWYRRWPIISGVVLIVSTNLVALGSAISNRSGTPDSILTLTQRELALPYDNWRIGENSGLALRLVWRTDQTQTHDAVAPSVWFGGEGDWLDVAKLTELGIKVRPRGPGNSESQSYSTSVPADVLLVLEMNGTVYRRQLDRACKSAGNDGHKDAAQTCERERREGSRLFVVDAGLDRDALRRKYPDAGVYAVVRGQIEAAIVPTSSASRVVGYVRGISTDEIQVPASMRAALGASGASARWQVVGQSQPFKATIAFGSRLEPWIVNLSAEREGSK